ncbi:MAG: hypothetical protein NTV23_07025 [Propionibacteriales bacterium]|nr:hypothetical protein [Propionibacteriales bacterium]
MTPPRFLRAVVAALIAAGMFLAVTPSAGTAAAPSPTAPCDAISPIAIPCVALGKTFDAVGAECRRAGIPDTLCSLPLAHSVTQAARDAYRSSWVHRTAQFQYELSDPVAFRDVQWIGTHNSFNGLSYPFTVSRADSNQQLSLTQQLDIDVRSLELDLHYVPGILGLLGPKVVTVCHGQGAEVGNLGCTTESSFAKVLPEIATWLNAPANSDAVILLYLEDAVKDPAAYTSILSTLAAVLKRPNGTSLVYRPNPADRAANGCVPLPLGTSRDDVRAAGARVVLVGSCAPGWSSAVFDWSSAHVESGQASAYRAFPACDATYGPGVYAQQVVRYFEDSTLVSTLLDPQRPPVNPEGLSPEKVEAMTNCGVNLFGFDQLLPEDGRIQSTLWSWAPDEPRAGAGGCTALGADGRWIASPCTEVRPAACLSGATWTVTAAVPAAQAAAACQAIGSTYGVPRTGDANSRLHDVAGASGAWVDHSIT